MVIDICIMDPKYEYMKSFLLHGKWHALSHELDTISRIVFFVHLKVINFQAKKFRETTTKIYMNVRSTSICNYMRMLYYTFITQSFHCALDIFVLCYILKKNEGGLLFAEVKFKLIKLLDFKKELLWIL